MEKLNLFIRLNKVDSVNRTVSGVATAEVVDKSGEIMDYESTVPYYKAWSAEIHKATDGKSLGNVRAMHGKVAAGKLTDIEFDDVAKQIRVTAKIVDEQEWAKCEEGVYTGFSQGGAYVKRWTDPANPAIKRYTADPSEISIVDNPCVGLATFDYVKSDGATEMRKFQVSADAEGDIEQVWRSKKDGACFAKKNEAVNHNLDIAVAKVNEQIGGVATALEVLKKAKDALTATSEAPANEPAQEPVEKVAEAEPARGEDGQIVTEADARATVVKAAAATLLQKGLFDVANLIDVINSMSWLTSDLNWNALFAEGESTLPQDCKAVLAQMCDLLTAMVAEATAAITADKAAGLIEAQVAAMRKFTGNEDLLKDMTFAALEPSDLEKAQASHAEALAQKDAELAVEKAARAEFETTITALTSGLEEVTKGIETVRAENASEKQAMEKRIQELADQPMPGKGFVGPGATVEKGHEGTETGSARAPVEASTKNFRGLSPVQAVKKFNAKKSNQ